MKMKPENQGGSTILYINIYDMK